MNQGFTFSKFVSMFSTDDECLEEIKKFRFQNGISCQRCKKITKHYKVTNRNAYACKFCRTQVYPLAGTIFEKTTTPLRLWFYAMYLMTYTRAGISIRDLQKELGVTYKTAWRMYHLLYQLMEQNKGDLLIPPEDKIRKWIFFNKIEISVVEKQEETEEEK